MQPYTQAKNLLQQFRLMWLAGFGIMALIGLGVFLAGMYTVVRGIQSSSWQETTGTLLSRGLDKNVSTSHSVSASSRDRHRTSTTYSAAVAYTYEVDGETYEGDRLKFGKVSTNRSFHRTFLNKYKKGQPLKVYYNPNDPVQSVLEPGLHWSMSLLPIFGLIFLAAGSGAVYLALNFKKAVASIIDAHRDEIEKMGAAEKNLEDAAELDPIDFSGHVAER